MGTCFNLKNLVIFSALLLLTVNQVSARNLTIVNFGGANGEAQYMAFIRPYEKLSNQNISPITYNGNHTKILNMVASGNVLWDVVEVETADLAHGCEDGLYENINWQEHLDSDDLVPGAIQYCGVGTFVWATVLAYNTKILKNAPSSWKDFWDTKKFPGKRGLREGARYNLEFALMADGVKTEDVYKVLATTAGVERAFAKLDQLKPNIVWWHAGTEPTQKLLAGDVTMSSAYNGRIDSAQRKGSSLQLVWRQSIYDMDYWVVIANSQNKDLAIDFIKYASSPQAQTKYSKLIAYGPISKLAIKNLSPTELKNIPNSPENAKQALLNNIEFWSKHGEALETRFNDWLKASN